MVSVQFIPYEELNSLSSVMRIHKILKLVKSNCIVVLQGKLNKKEEADLIALTMEEISNKFRGIELSTINPPVKKWKDKMFNKIFKSRQGMTIIGPANIVKKVQQDPTKVNLLLENPSMLELN